MTTLKDIMESMKSEREYFLSKTKDRDIADLDVYDRAVVLTINQYLNELQKVTGIEV